MNYLNGQNRNFKKKLQGILAKRRLSQKNVNKVVLTIINDVKKNKDKSLLKFEKKYSKIKSQIKNIKFTNKEIQNIKKKIR